MRNIVFLLFKSGPVDEEENIVCQEKIVEDVLDVSIFDYCRYYQSSKN